MRRLSLLSGNAAAKMKPKYSFSCETHKGSVVLGHFDLIMNEYSVLASRGLSIMDSE